MNFSTAIGNVKMYLFGYNGYIQRERKCRNSYKTLRFVGCMQKRKEEV